MGIIGEEREKGTLTFLSRRRVPKLGCACTDAARELRVNSTAGGALVRVRVLRLIEF